jgi:chemotaxis protein methyltransferase CheR
VSAAPRTGPLLDEALLQQLEALLRSACGLTLAPGLRRSLEPALARAAHARAAAPEAFLERLLSREPAAVESFIEQALIGETYFCRHPEHLEVLTRYARERQDPAPLRVWSAGCASGEEPYSVAMAMLAAGVPPLHFKVVGTDVSNRALARARAARYGQWSMRRILPELERRYLLPDGPFVTVSPQVTARVELRRNNLVLDPAPVSGVQAVFCRNVLIYFPPDLVRTVLQKLVATLVPGGLLFLAPAEVPMAAGLGLEQRELHGTPYLRLPLSARTPPPSLNLTPIPMRTPLPAAGPAAVVDVAGPRSELEQALEAAREGRYDVAERLALAAARSLSPEAYLLLGMVAEARGDLAAAVTAVRKALYLEPQLALGHATLVSLYGRMQQHAEAERARTNALRALEGLEDDHLLRGVEAVTAGGLRSALDPAQRRERWSET